MGNKIYPFYMSRTLSRSIDISRDIIIIIIIKVNYIYLVFIKFRELN